MTYFEQVPKKKLQEYQKKSNVGRNRYYEHRYIEAVLVFELFHDIKDVMDKFHVKRDAAYKMVRKGRGLIQ